MSSSSCSSSAMLGSPMQSTWPWAILASSSACVSNTCGGEGNEETYATIVLSTIKTMRPFHENIDGLVQERRNSSALALELHFSCTNPSIFPIEIQLSRIWFQCNSNCAIDIATNFCTRHERIVVMSLAQICSYCLLELRYKWMQISIEFELWVSERASEWASKERVDLTAFLKADSEVHIVHISR